MPNLVAGRDRPLTRRSSRRGRIDEALSWSALGRQRENQAPVYAYINYVRCRLETCVPMESKYKSRGEWCLNIPYSLATSSFWCPRLESYVNVNAVSLHIACHNRAIKNVTSLQPPGMRCCTTWPSRLARRRAHGWRSHIRTITMILIVSIKMKIYNFWSPGMAHAASDIIVA